MAYKKKNFWQTDSEKEAGDDLWTKESARVYQIVTLENKINAFKEIGHWEPCLNAMEDYLRFQMELMQEKETFEEDGKKKTRTLKGMETPTYLQLKTRLRDMQKRIREASRRVADPAARSNNAEDYEDLIDQIKDTIDELYQLNVSFGLSYKKKLDPYEAYKEEEEY